MKTDPLYRTLREKLRKKQSRKRFEHSVSVGDFAAKLGKEHGWRPDRARLAGLLHDYAKEWSPKKMLQYVKKRKLKIPNLDFILEYAPNMMHAYIGADVVRRKKWITHKNDLRAIASHTLGREDMGLEEKILYIADFSAPGRTYSSAEAIRKIAMKSLRDGFRECITHKIGWHLKKNRAIHPLSVLAWNHFCRVRP
jgi:predicted HD superfamily hydrolase involved in NAD metabolism